MYLTMKQLWIYRNNLYKALNRTGLGCGMWNDVDGIMRCKVYESQTKWKWFNKLKFITNKERVGTGKEIVCFLPV